MTNQKRWTPIIALIVSLTALNIVGCSYDNSGDTSVRIENTTTPGETLPAEEVYQNIQSLKGMPAVHLTDVMNYFWNSLGVHCVHCHVLDEGGWNFVSDEKETKRTARRMISMVKSINANNFEEENRVTCFTCHRGSSEPVEFMYMPGNAMSFSEYRNMAEDSLPNLDSVLDKYKEAIGAEKLVEISGLKSFEGTFKDFGGWRERHYQIFISDNDNYLFIATDLGEDPGITTYGFNGDSAWASDGTETQRADSRLAYNTKNFLGLLDFSDLLSDVENLSIVRVESVDGEEVSVIKRPIDDLTWEEFYISAENGLPLKRVIYLKTPVAVVTIEAVFGNYEKVDGIQVAHNFRYETGDLFQSGIFEIEKVQFVNNAVDISFSPPN